MIGDKYFNFQKDVAAGFFDELKGEFGDLNEFLEKNEQQIKDIATAIGANFAGAITKTSDLIKGVAPAVKTVSNALGTTITGFTSLPSFVQSSGLIAALLFGKKGMVAFGTISFLLGQIEELMAKAEAIPEGAFVNIDNLEEAQTKMDIVQRALKQLETSLSDRGIDVFNIDSLDLSKLDEGEIKRLNFIIQYRRQIDELNLAMKNIFLKELGEESNAFSRVITHDFRKAEKEVGIFKSSLGFLPEMLESGAKAQSKLSFAQERSTVTLQGYNSEMAILGTVSTRHIEEQLSAFERFNEGFKNAMDKSTFDGFQRAGETAFNSLKKTMTDFVVTGKLDMKSFEVAVKRAIVEALIGQAVQFALDKATRMFKLKSIKTALGNVYEAGTLALKSAPPPLNFILAGGVIAGGLAMVSKIRGFEKGGRPPINTPSIVGERGAELFVPDQAGTIIPNNKLGGTTNISLNIYANDSEGFDDLLIKRRSTIINVINDALNTQGKEALV